MTEIATRAPFARLRRASGRALSFLLWVLVLLLLFCQATIWLRPEAPRLAVFEQFAIQLGGAAVLGMTAGLIFRRWKQGALLALLAATLLWPVLGHRGEASAIPDPPRLKVVSANLWHAASGHDRTVAVLTASDADVIGLVEVTPAWRAALAPLIARYPYRVDCRAATPDCHYLLLSRLPIVKPYAGRIFKATPMVVGGELAWNGRPITLIETHLFRPFRRSDESMWGGDDPARAGYMADDLPVSRQAGQAGLLAKYLNRLPQDLLLMGDFNGVPWSRVQRALREATGLDNQAGWDFTWPSSFPRLLRLPLDHVLARGHLVVTKFEAGPMTDSDHLPVIAEIGWRD